MSRRDDKAKAKVEEAKGRAAKAVAKDQAAKDALVEKVNQKGGAGKLTKKELDLAKRMGEGEGKNNNP